jgi:hypothetical protein
VSKAIGRFEPTPSRSPEECERHYTQVHVRMAQDLLAPMGSLRSYHIDRAVAQADINGLWAQRPRAWRFVVLRFNPGEALAFTPAQSEMIAQDHVNCLYRMRHCDVEESVLFDRLDRQLTLAKFMIEADRPPAVEPASAWSAFAALAERVHAAMQEAFGARRLLLNRALNELETEPVDVDGQRPIGLLETTTRVGYLEAYFDHPRWGEETLGALVASGAVSDSALCDLNVLRVEELAPIDKSPGGTR